MQISACSNNQKCVKCTPKGAIRGKSPNWPTVHSLPGITMWQFPQILSVGNKTQFPCRLDNILRFSTFLLCFLHESNNQGHLQVQGSCLGLGCLDRIVAGFHNLCMAPIAAPWQIIHCLKATEISFEMVYNLLV